MKRIYLILYLLLISCSISYTQSDSIPEGYKIFFSIEEVLADKEQAYMLNMRQQGLEVISLEIGKLEKLKYLCFPWNFML